MSTVRLLAIALASVLVAAPGVRAEITLEPGWPVSTGFSVSPSATAAQMDADPELEIVIASQDEYLYVFNHDGTVVPGWPQWLGETLWPDPWANTNSSPAVADIDGDGWPEVIVGSLNAKLFVFNHDGTYVPGFPYSTSFMVYSTPALGDIDGDGELEIVVGDNHGYVYAINLDGSDVPGFPYATPYTVHASPALGDLDGDGYPEIVIASEADNPDFYAIDGDGSDLPGFPLDLCPAVGIISSPTLADLDLDGSLDIVVGLRNGEIVVLDAHGEFLPGWPLDAGYSCQSSPTVVNLDDDPELEFVVGMNDSQVVAYNHDGTPLPGWPVSTSFTVISSPSVADIDADGRLEIVVGDNTGKVYGFEIDGSPVAGFPLTDATYTIYSSPLLADLDLDGHLELLVGCNDMKVYCWDLGEGTWDPELLPWPEFRRDSVNNARVDRPAYLTLSTPNPTVPAGGVLEVDVAVTSIVSEPAAFELWYRIFGEYGAVAWPSAPDPLAVELGPGEVLTMSEMLTMEAGLAPGDYFLQGYLGEYQAGSFDTRALSIRIVPLGDTNCDDAVDAFDIDPFVLALTDTQAYQAQYPECNLMTADVNLDGEVNAFDIDPFVELLVGR